MWALIVLVLILQAIILVTILFRLPNQRVKNKFRGDRSPRQLPPTNTIRDISLDETIGIYDQKGRLMFTRPEHHSDLPKFRKLGYKVKKQ